MTARPIVVLTGAGISRESGLHTFRDADGVWSRVRLEDVATPEAFRRDPARVHAFYDARRRAALDPAVQPNAAHRALVRLEREHRAPVLVVTQNVDDLHERAGTRALLHMHGELLRARCGRCGATSPAPATMDVGTACRACGEAGGLRPDIVWFGEMPMHMDASRRRWRGAGCSSRSAPRAPCTRRRASCGRRAGRGRARWS